MRGQIDFPLHPGSSYSGLTDWRHVEEEDPGHRLCLLIGSSILNPLTLLKLYYSVSSMLMIEAIDTPWYGNNLVQMSWMRREGVEGCIRCIFVRGKKASKGNIFTTMWLDRSSLSWDTGRLKPSAAEQYSARKEPCTNPYQAFLSTAFKHAGAGGGHAGFKIRYWHTNWEESTLQSFECSCVLMLLT